MSTTTMRDEDTRPSSSGWPKLRLRGVNKTLGEGEQAVTALTDISLDVRPGEFLMLVGPTGCGKSTLLNLIAGFHRPTSGEIYIDDRLVDGPSPERNVVFQEGALFPWLTVRGNLEFGLKQAGMPANRRRERARHYLEKVGMAKFEDYPVHRLSAGMRQRVAIARSLVLEPEIILMDEPFSALDAPTREDLYLEMQEMWQERSTTVVCVTHNVREAVTLGDRVVLMSPRPGRIVGEFEIGILRPRQIDDVDVAARAQQIAQAMKRGRRVRLEPLIDEHSQENRFLFTPFGALDLLR